MKSGSEYVDRDGLWITEYNFNNLGGKSRCDKEEDQYVRRSLRGAWMDGAESRPIAKKLESGENLGKLL